VRRLRLYFWVFLALTLGFIAWSRIYIKPLTTKEIVKFEVAKHLPKAERMLFEWKLEGKMEKARDSVYADFLFIILYSGCLITGVLLVSRLSKHILLLRTGRFISLLIPVAAVCDVVENMAMLKTLNGAGSAFYVMLTYDMAVAKFSIIILALIFVFICVLFWIGSRFTPKKVMVSSEW
jgi:hypothetical protein